MNALIAKYLQEMAAGGGEVPPSWQQGVTATPPPQPQQFDVREYFKAMRPELFSQGAVDDAMASDEATNARNAGLRRMESGAAGFGLRAPSFAGMEPTQAGMQALQARQQQALQSADVGSKVGQFMQSADDGDPRSPRSRMFYRIAAQDPYIGPHLAALGPEGTVSKAQLDALVASRKAGGDLGKDAATIAKDTSAAGKSEAERATEEALRGGRVEEQGFKNADLKLKPAATAAGTANTIADTNKKIAEANKISAPEVAQQFDVDFTPPTIKAPDGVVNPIVAAAGDARASLGMIKELKGYMANGVPVAGATKARVDQLVTSLQMKLKNIYGLGVLNKSDMDLLDRVVKSPTGIVAWLQSGTGLRDFVRMLDGLETDTKTGIRARAQGIGSTPKPGSVFAEDAAPPAGKEETAPQPAAPPNAAFYSRSTGKFYDANHKEIP